jgi:phosphoribosylamine--glycine ligase
MKVLVIGQGGREHAVAWKLIQSEKVEKVFVCPGNGGTAKELNIENIDLSPADTLSLIDFASREKIDLTIVGPEAPLVDGIVDEFNKHNLKIFGPSKKYALLEGSKVFSKEFMKNYDIPTADYQMFSSGNEAKDFIKDKQHPIVIKADGLAAGKGVIVSQSENESFEAIDELLASNHSDYIVIEEFLSGQELSAIYVCNFKGCSYEIALPWTKDYKSRDEYNSGPNTGGMGAISHPLGYEHKNSIFKLHIDIEKIMIKTITSINDYNKNFNNGYLGFLYIGLMIDNQNNIKVLEYNCRLGDPETQNLMLTLENKKIDLLDLIINQPISSIKDINLDKIEDPDTSFCCTLVLAATGYPGKYKKGFYIDHSDVIENNNLKIFHAGTTLKNDKFQSTGGRILTINAYSDTKENALAVAYENIKKIKIYEDEDMKIQNQDLVFYREDIGN